MRAQDALEFTRHLAKTCRMPGLLQQTWGSHSLAAEGVFTGDRDAGLSQRERDTAMDRIIARQLPALLETADSYFVDRGLVDVVERMGPSVPDEARLHPKLLPSATGCLWFDRPIAMPPRRLTRPDDRPDLPEYEPAPLSGFAWEVQDGGIMFAYVYSWAVDNSTPSWAGGTYVGNIPLAVTPWSWSTSTLGTYIRAHNAHIRTNPEETDTNNAKRYAISARACVATLLLMDQQLTVCTTMPIDRGTRRRMEREGWKNKPSIQVITLRRLDYSHVEHAASAVDWSCRWIVREHWRTLDRGLESERTVLIPMYVKGPADKPLKVPAARVWAVVR